MSQDAEDRPTERGRLCVLGFFAFLAAGGALLALEPGARVWPVIAFLASVVAVMGTSALYHRVVWSPAWYARIRRLDHAMIFALIVGSEAPLFLVVLDGEGWTPVFVFALVAASIGFAITMLWPDAPKWVRAVVYIVVGWSAVPAAGALYGALGPSGFGLLLLGGALYSIGGVAYGLRWPNPWPGRFGYHEVFHALVIAAAASHFMVVATWAV